MRVNSCIFLSESFNVTIEDGIAMHGRTTCGRLLKSALELSRSGAFLRSVFYCGPQRLTVSFCFYLVAKNVKPLCREVQAALTAWKEGWKNATLMDPTPADPEPVAAQVTSVLAEFGDQFIKLATPVWEIQRPALEKAPWLEA